MVFSFSRRGSSVSSADDRCDDVSKTVIETIDYLKEYLHDVEDGPEKASFIRSRCLNLQHIVDHLDIGIGEATQAMKIVREHAALLGKDNVELIRSSICRSSDKGISRKLTGKQPVGPGGKPVIEKQVHLYIEHYLTNGLWTALRSDIELLEKFQIMKIIIIQ